MKHGIYYAYWEKEWAADYTYYVDKVARLGFDILEVGAAPLPDRRGRRATRGGPSKGPCAPPLRSRAPAARESGGPA